MPRESWTLLKLPPSDQMLCERQFSAMPLLPAHQNAEVTCWIQTLFTSQLSPLKSTAPLLLFPARLEPLQSRDRFCSLEDVPSTMFAMPWVLLAGVTRYRVLYQGPAPSMSIPEGRKPPLMAL